MLETGVRPTYSDSFHRLQDSLRRLDDGLRPTGSAIIEHVRHLRPNPYVLILLTFAVVEALLGYRLWAQLTSQADSGTTDHILDITNAIVSPFRHYDVTPMRSTGIFEFSTLAAMEAILIAALVSITAIYVIGNFTRISYRIATRGHRRAAAQRVAGDGTFVQARSQSVVATEPILPPTRPQAATKLTPDVAPLPIDE